MTERFTVFCDFGMSCWIRSLCVATFGLWMFAGCDHRPEAAKQAWPETDNESFEPVDPSMQPLGLKTEIQLSGQTLKPEPRKPRSEEDPVSACLRVSQQSIIGETFELTVVLGVDSGYEIHSLSASPPKIATQLELQLPSGFSALEDWRSPAPIRSFNPGVESVYVGESNFVRKIQVTTDVEPGDYLLVCSVSYQACNSRQCLRPIEALLSVKISVSH